MEYPKAISPHRLLVYEDGQIKGKRANHSQNDSYNYPLYWINLKNPIVEVVKNHQVQGRTIWSKPFIKEFGFIYFKSHFRVPIFLIRLKRSLNVTIPTLNT